MDDDFRRKRNIYIYNSFRDIADRDYIAARALHRIKLFNQFSWAALQSLEKYLKTILLIYNEDTREIGHNLINGLNKVESIQDINWDFDKRIRNFLDYLTIFGNDRYFTIPYGNRGDELFTLDYSVWKIRRYCKDFYWMKREDLNLYNSYTNYIQSNICKKRANKFVLDFNGYLEKALKIKRLKKQREHLVYKNFYYGSYKKHRIKTDITIESATPVHYHFPEIYDWVKERVKLIGKAKEIFENRDRNN